ncbi:unnamed protein product [Cutaneotrichosporon oleaginosum]
MVEDVADIAEAYLISFPPPPNQFTALNSEEGDWSESDGNEFYGNNLDPGLALGSTTSPSTALLQGDLIVADPRSANSDAGDESPHPDLTLTSHLRRP